MQAPASKLQQAMEGRDTAAIIAAMQGVGPQDTPLLPEAAKLLAHLLATATSPAPTVGFPLSPKPNHVETKTVTQDHVCI